MYLSITRSPLHFLSSPHPCQSILKWHSTYLPIPLLDLLLCLSHPFNMHPPEDVSAWKSNNPKTFYQFFEVTSYLWRHQSVLGTFSIFWPCLKEKKKTRTKITQTICPRRLLLQVSSTTESLGYECQWGDYLLTAVWCKSDCSGGKQKPCYELQLQDHCGSLSLCHIFEWIYIWFGWMLACKP